MFYQYFNFQTKKKSCNISFQFSNKKKSFNVSTQFSNKKKSNKISMQFCNDISRKIFFFNMKLRRYLMCFQSK